MLPRPQTQAFQQELSAELCGELPEVPAEKQPPNHRVSEARRRGKGGKQPCLAAMSFSPRKPCEQPGDLAPSPAVSWGYNVMELISICQLLYKISFIEV